MKYNLLHCTKLWFKCFVFYTSDLFLKFTYCGMDSLSAFLFSWISWGKTNPKIFLIGAPKRKQIHSINVCIKCRNKFLVHISIFIFMLPMDADHFKNFNAHQINTKRNTNA